MMNYSDAKRYVRTLSTVRYVEERPFMIAVVELADTDIKNAIGSQRSGRVMVAKGLSTCSPTDKWDSKRGQDVARGRAEAKLARRVMRMAAKKAMEAKKAVTIDASVITIDANVTVGGCCADYVT